MLALLLGVIPGLTWLAFYLDEDLHPEPKREIFYAFLAGSGVTLIVLGFEYWFNDTARLFNIGDYSIISLLGLAFIEEFFKFGATFLLISKSSYFDEPVDAMIYMVVVALGFATLENIGAISGDINHAGVIGVAIGTTSLRFVGATLLHTLASAIVGYHWARGLVRKSSLTLSIATGLLIATALHALFNYLVIYYETILLYPVILLFFAGFFVLNDFDKLKHPETNEITL